MALTINADMESVIKQNILPLMLTDSLFLFDVLTKSSTTLKRRLMIDVQTVRDTYQSLEVINVVFLRSERH